MDAFIGEGLGNLNFYRNEGPYPTVSVAAGTAPSESGPTQGVFAISLSRAFSVSLTVPYTLSGSTAANPDDYTISAGANISAVDGISFTLASNVISATLLIDPVDDGLIDPGETVVITLSGGSDYLTNGNNNAASQTIGDNDVVPHDHWGESWNGSGTGLDLDSINDTGLRGQSNATTGTTYGVYGLSQSTSGRGVYGYASAAANTSSYAVYGLNRSTGGGGVQGQASALTGDTVGVYGEVQSTAGRGVNASAVATTGTTYGVYGASASIAGRGVYGYASAGTGLTFGVFGQSRSDSGHGVYGYASATTGETTGVGGSVRSAVGWAGRFTSSYGKGVYISVPAGKVGLTVAQGTKNAVVATADGARLVYAEEATEVWFTDYGTGTLENGLAEIPIDPVFAQTVNLEEPYHVFVQVNGDAQVYVAERTLEGFTVRLRDGDPDVGFFYRVVAKRLGHEGRRLERAPWADDDPNLYPDRKLKREGRNVTGAPATEEPERNDEAARTLEAVSSEAPEPHEGSTDGDRGLAAAGERNAAGNGRGTAELQGVALAAIHDHWGESWSGGLTGLTLISSDGTGVQGQSNANVGEWYGVYGESKSNRARSVYGWASGAGGETYGIYGLSASTEGYGVAGIVPAATGASRGAFGRAKSTSGRAVYGYASAQTGTTTGVYGVSASIKGRGVSGRADAATGTTFGVYGYTESISGCAVYGYAAATNGAATGVWGKVRSPDGWAGRFTSDYGNGVYISVPANKPGLNVVRGTKNAVVSTADGARLLYAEEASEVWFADYGFGRLSDGAAVIGIDPVYAQTVNLDEPYHVFLQAYGDVVVYVSERTAEQFVVLLRDGDPNAAFSYRVVAKRLGHEEARLEPAPWADDDPNLRGERRLVAEEPRGIANAVARLDEQPTADEAPEPEKRTSETTSGAAGRGTADQGALPEDPGEPPMVMAVGPHDHWGESWRGTGTGLTVISSDGTGIRAVSSKATGLKYAVHGVSKSQAGRAVYGQASAATGTTYGVLGRSESTKGRGVFGYASATTGTTYGLYGYSQSTSGIGVSGRAGAASGTTFGVYALSRSTSGRGLYGHATAATDTTYGVYGVSDSSQGRAVYGYASAETGDTMGVWGSVRSPDGWAGRFTSDYGKGVYISVPPGKIGLTVASGTKNAVVATEDGARLLYVEESTEVWFSDYGLRVLEDGVAVIPIDPLFAQTVNLDEAYLVFVQGYGDAGLYVSDLGPEGFVVRSRVGDANTAFSYRVVAKRLGYEQSRLERAPWADGDPHLKSERVQE